MQEEHKKEFDMYDKITSSGKTLAKLTYVMGFLDDTSRMTTSKEALLHIKDAREMLGIIAKEVAKLEGIKVV